MQQLAAGLYPQNLLLSTDDNDAALKIADSEFARSLQPRGLAETLWFLTVYGSRDYAASKV
ncbi:BnaC06g42570D [Brassica napus]|uniref:BnaC06g42570D protein n=1 Tax=Brassica napus TaxID=3708 RepID=A0A078J750_BRANA|nr:BnaC06g42570D [Brassica napus]